MRKVYCFNMISLDGYFEGPNRNIDWHNVDGDFNKFAIKQLEETDLLLFGRVTYELMTSYWPTEAGTRESPVIAGLMNDTQKIVFSRTLNKADWKNTILVKNNAAEEVSKLKHLTGKDIAIFGSSNLSLTLAQNGLIDEYRIVVNPVLLGAGNSFLKGLRDRINLKLIDTRVFDSGNVLLYYQPKY